MNANLTGSGSRRRPPLFQEVPFHLDDAVLLAEPLQFGAFVDVKRLVLHDSVLLGFPDPVPQGRLADTQVAGDLSDGLVGSQH